MRPAGLLEPCPREPFGTEKSKIGNIKSKNGKETALSITYALKLACRLIATKFDWRRDPWDL
jgi:hypothetical protein